MHSNSDNIEIMIYDKANEAIEKILEILFNTYQVALETSIKGSNFIFDFVNFLYCKPRKMNLQLGGSYIDSPDWVKNKKATINPINYVCKCFQNAAIVALNYEEIGKNSQRIPSIKPFINKYNWKGIHYPS